MDGLTLQMTMNEPNLIISKGKVWTSLNTSGSALSSISPGQNLKLCSAQRLSPTTSPSQRKLKGEPEKDLWKKSRNSMNFQLLHLCLLVESEQSDPWDLETGSIMFNPSGSGWIWPDLAKVQQGVLHQINVPHGAVDEGNQHLGRTVFLHVIHPVLLWNQLNCSLIPYTQKIELLGSICRSM